MDAIQLLAAYQNGFFPMPDPDSGEILWMRPSTRAVIPLDKFHTSRSLIRSMRRYQWSIVINKNFVGVMEGCRQRPDTWITDEFVESYENLHKLGFAHSVEVYLDGNLVGGTYGVSMGGAFFAESKFHLKTDASKIAIYSLVKHMKDRGLRLLEVQFLTQHLASLGAIEIPHPVYMNLLKEALAVPVTFDPR